MPPEFSENQPEQCKENPNPGICIEKRRELNDNLQANINFSGQSAENSSEKLSLTRARHVVENTTFQHHQFSDGVFQQYVKSYRQILKRRGTPSYFYYNVNGEIVGEALKPPHFEEVQIAGDEYQDEIVGTAKASREEIQQWHNQQRTRFSDVLVLPQSYQYLGYPFVAFSREKGLSDTLENLQEKGQDSRYFNGESISLNDAIIRICGAYDVDVEKAFGFGTVESNFERNALSPAGAYGIFQLKEGAYKDALLYIKAHPELHTSFRDGDLTEEYAEGKKNRFIQIEAFCAYFKFLEQLLSSNINALNARIQKIDPTFQFNDPSIIIITAYNYGPGNIQKAINRFVVLSDEEIKKHIGKPPYGLDVWMGLLGHSFGAENRLGLSGLTYAAKVTAAGSLIMGREKTLAIARKVEEEKPAPDSLKGAKERLDKTYEDLRKRKSHATTPAEKVTRRKYLIGPQIRVLKPTMNKAFTKDFVEKYYRDRRRKRGESWRNYATRRGPIYDQGIEKQEAYHADALKSGDLVKMLPDDPSKPYFCEQVGRWSGTGNNPDALYMRKEFETLMSSLVELVNYQIDLFNKSPQDYGYKSFPKIPHITAIKVSGAYRTFSQMKAALSNGMIRRSTTHITPHLLGYALDIGSFATDKAHMVRFKEAMKDNKGKVRIKAGEKLPTNGFDSSTRNILSRMIGRALMTIKEPKIMPLWEQGQLNWHVMIVPE